MVKTKKTEKVVKTSEEKKIVESSAKSKEEVIQPELSIGLVGHVDHGKTTLLERLSGKWADIHSEEVKRGITIKLGYADASYYFCKKCNSYGRDKKCVCGGEAEFVRKVSFVDAPGHETLMATMLSGAAIIDAALLLVSADEPCPQPQTEEHLMALSLIGIKNIIIVQNKIDLVSKEDAIKNYNSIKNFVKGTIAENSLIIPISAKHNLNIDKLIEAIATIPVPNRDLNKDPLMFIARSFDVNKPGSEIKGLVGGILGGSIKQGKLRVGDEVEIAPGIKKDENKNKYDIIKAKIIDIKTGGKSVKEAIAGGSIAILTELDPSIVKSDTLAGNTLGLIGKLPEIYYEINLVPKLFDRVIGVKTQQKVEPIKKSEALMINVNSSVSLGVVSELSKDKVHLVLKRPVCASSEDRFCISRRVDNRWRLIGYGLIKK